MIPQARARPPIAYGRTAEIYPWGDGQVLKLFYACVPEEDVRHEALVARAVHATGLAVPAAGEVIQVEGRLGLVYERLEGLTLGDEMTARPWKLVRLARLLAKCHVEMHAVGGIEGAPSQRERLAHKIRDAEGLDPPLQEAVLHALDRMPQADRLCHGDFHPWNVMLVDGGARVIDWFGATRGNPLADVARTAVVLESVREMTASVTRWERLLTGCCLRIYLRTYFELRPGGEAEYQAWRPILAAARMSERIEGLKDWLLAQVEAETSLIHRSYVQS